MSVCNVSELVEVWKL